MKPREWKQMVLETAKQGYAEKLFAGTSGNVSVYDPERGFMAITPSGVPYQTMKTEDIVWMTPEGETAESAREPSSEWRAHAAIYQTRPDIRAVVHTHSPYATGFAVCHRPIPLILIEMIPFVGGDIPVAEFAVPGTKDLGLAALAALSGRTSCLLANHGVLAVGEDSRKAYLAAVYTEDAAKICAYAEAVGEIQVIPEETRNSVRRKLGL